MPSEQDHQGAYEKHYQAYLGTVTAHPDWGAVMLFYCAVHAVEQMFASEQVHHTEHHTRETRLKTAYASVWFDYKRLRDESMKARYLHNGHFSLPPDRVRTVLEPKLRAIVNDIKARQEARQLVSPALLGKAMPPKA